MSRCLESSLIVLCEVEFPAGHRLEGCVHSPDGISYCGGRERCHPRILERKWNLSWREPKVGCFLAQTSCCRSVLGLPLCPLCSNSVEALQPLGRGWG